MVDYSWFISICVATSQQVNGPVKFYLNSHEIFLSATGDILPTIQSMPKPE